LAEAPNWDKKGNKKIPICAGKQMSNGLWTIRTEGLKALCNRYPDKLFVPAGLVADILDDRRGILSSIGRYREQNKRMRELLESILQGQDGCERRKDGYIILYSSKIREIRRAIGLK
jgi:hypothetical protein